MHLRKKTVPESTLYVCYACELTACGPRAGSPDRTEKKNKKKSIGEILLVKKEKKRKETHTHSVNRATL